jgi:UDP-N-acetylmuramate dehydrogenase
MTPGWKAALERALPGRVRLGVPLAPLTTYRIGGPADALLEPRDTDEIRAALTVARESETPWIALGLGSNLLVADAGFRGLVLRIGKPLSTLRVDGECWSVGAGLPTPLLARRTAARGFAGVHRLIGVPGTVGGGVFMNAGAHGQDFGSVVRAVTVVTAAGDVEQRNGGAIPWQYRSSGLGAVVVVATDLVLAEEDPRRLKADVHQHLRWRKAGTPFNAPCCGSVFRNPERPVSFDGSELRTAGQLIDAAGLKDFSVGGARVSPVHANYIVNTGNARADDVRRVIDAVLERVAEMFGVELQLEVQLVGWADSR